jgi:hypothetical protein
VGGFAFARALFLRVRGISAKGKRAIPISRDGSATLTKTDSKPTSRPRLARGAASCYFRLIRGVSLQTRRSPTSWGLPLGECFSTEPSLPARVHPRIQVEPFLHGAEIVRVAPRAEGAGGPVILDVHDSFPGVDEW